MGAPAVRMVLVDTSHPGNIGAAARALKNMELDALALVRPRQFPHPDAVARASGADDLLARATVHAEVAGALQGCGLVLACTARTRDHYHRVLDVREAAVRIVAEAAVAPVAVLFGGEHSGLSNEDLACAHALVRIPTGEAYASLNLAMAVQVVAYEILRARRAAAAAPAGQGAMRREVPLADAAAMGRLYAHLERVLELVDFRDRTQAGTHLMGRFRRFLQRAELDGNEVNILRGLLTAVEQRRRRAGTEPPAVPGAPDPGAPGPEVDG